MHRSASAVELDCVVAHRKRRLVLDDVSLAVPRGAIAAIVGPNGSGKSTLFGVISGRLRATRGSVAVGGAVSEVLQSASIDEQTPLTVDDVVRQGRYRDRGLLRPMTRHDRRIVDDALEAVEMVEHRRTPIHRLSGGQRQRALVAQGIAQQAPILLLDEPTTGLDQPSQHRLREVIRNAADAGTTVLFSTHSLHDATQSDLMVALACCRCVCCAPTDEALRDPQVVELFDPTRVPVPPPRRRDADGHEATRIGEGDDYT